MKPGWRYWPWAELVRSFEVDATVCPSRTLTNGDAIDYVLTRRIATAATSSLISRRRTAFVQQFVAQGQVVGGCSRLSDDGHDRCSSTGCSLQPVPDGGVVPSVAIAIGASSACEDICKP